MLIFFAFFFGKPILPRTSFSVEIRMEGYTNIQYLIVECNKNIYNYLLMSKYTKININVKSRMML
ncbi:hypothetical protein EUBIFOR_01411 [Holdemanella biformis DSM 3989]|uniref:Uncharacterized protein n=1 Tax=Holdemanella biformis DSM 3989 TaxID=518637 RepID=B7CB40_9FIRM|nr:hypothetical protein EUBIFOR_01411 [Holdemanella biformis DSM 3989]